MTSILRVAARAVVVTAAICAGGMGWAHPAEATHVYAGAPDCQFGTPEAPIYGPCSTSAGATSLLSVSPAVIGLPSDCNFASRATVAAVAACREALRQPLTADVPTLPGLPPQCQFGGLYFDGMSCIELLAGAAQDESLSTVPATNSTLVALPAVTAIPPPESPVPASCVPAQLARYARGCLDAIVQLVFYAPEGAPNINSCTTIATGARAAGAGPCDPKGAVVNCGPDISYTPYYAGSLIGNEPFAGATQFCELPDARNLSGRNMFTTYRYGACDMVWDDAVGGYTSGCAAPVEVQSAPLCERHPSLYSIFESGQQSYQSLSVRGVPAALFHDDMGAILEVYTGTTTISILGRTDAEVRQVADTVAPAPIAAIPAIGAYIRDVPELRAETSSGTLPPPNPVMLSSLEDCSAPNLSVNAE